MNLSKESTNYSTEQIAGILAGVVMQQSKPVSPVAHLIKSLHTTQLFLPNGSQLYSINQFRTSSKQIMKLACRKN